MKPTDKLKTFLSLVSVLAALSLLLTLTFHPPTVSGRWLIAFVTLVALALLGVLLSLRLEQSASTSMEFISQLGAIPLLGPAGAIILSVVTSLLSDFLIRRKERTKALFNTGQVVLSVSAASYCYIAFGGAPGLDALPFYETFPPFIVAVLAYFATNTILVSYVISLSEGQSFSEIWREAAGGLIVFDLAISPLAYLVAFLYVQWGALALLAAILPIIGLRHSYGVNIELQQLNQDLLRVLIKTLEARDQYTSGHSVRVAERSRRLAIALNIRPARIRLIETAALLHDIGKIDLAYSEILRQAGPLTPEQRELIRAHPDKGVDILKSVRSMNPQILRCIRHHHEWFDGSGYPVGLAGEEIPLGARIIMVADAIDAMMTDRPYRSALSTEEIRQELIRNSGTQFDPTLVSITLGSSLLDEFITIGSPTITAPHSAAALVTAKT